MEANNAKKPIEFHTKPPKVEKTRSIPSAKGPYIRGLFYLILLAAVTYVAKFSGPEPTIVRKHSFVSWTFPTQKSHSVLFVTPDDDNDSNFVRTGHRIWIDPPREPALINKNAARFAGPIMSVFAKEISTATLEELILSVDSGGSIQVSLENPQPELKNYQGKWQNRSVHIYELNTSRPNLKFQLSENETLEVRFTPTSRTFSLKSQGYHIIHHRGANQPPLGVQSTASLVYWFGASEQDVEAWNTSYPTVAAVIGLESKPSFQWNENKIPLFEKNFAALFYEEKQQLNLKKIKLIDWDGRTQ